MGVNNAAPELYLHSGRRNVAGNSPLRVRLVGSKGNPQAIGARIELKAEGMPGQIREVNGGGSYLSQSGPTLLLARPTGAAVKLQVRWPDGVEESRSVKAGENSVVITKN